MSTQTFKCEECGFETEIFVVLLDHDLEKHTPTEDGTKRRNAAPKGEANNVK